VNERTVNVEENQSDHAGAGYRFGSGLATLQRLAVGIAAPWLHLTAPPVTPSIASSS
jgi:hypothetical protein